MIDGMGGGKVIQVSTVTTVISDDSVVKLIVIRTEIDSGNEIDNDGDSDRNDSDNCKLVMLLILTKVE